MSLVNAVKRLCAHYLFNQWLVLLDFGDLDFIFKVTPHFETYILLEKGFMLYAGGVSNKSLLLIIFIFSYVAFVLSLTVPRLSFFFFYCLGKALLRDCGIFRVSSHTCSRTSMARTSLGPWKVVLDMGSWSH